MSLSHIQLTPQFVQAVREAVDIVEVAAGYTKLSRAGRKHRGLCPLHKEKTPSFHVDGELGFFKCFGCGAGGDAIKLHMLLTGDDFPAAMEALAQRFGVSLPAPSAAHRGARARVESERIENLAARTEVELADWITMRAVGNFRQLLAVFGRLLLRNALGPAATALPVPISVQSWQGSVFGTNTLDSCTAIPRSAIVLSGYQGTIAPGPNCNSYVQQNPVAFAAGVGTLTLAAPTGGTSGSVLLSPNLYSTAAGSYCAAAGSAPAAATAASMQYLLGRWNDLLDPDAIASTVYDDNPSARAAFGLYGSQPNNLIFQRENY